MNIQEKINALMEQEAFAAAFRAATNPQEVVDLFAANGIEVPMTIAEELFTPAIHMEGELTEDMLDHVSGGGAVGSGIGGAIGNGIFYGAGYLGGRLAGWSKSKSKEYAKSCSKFGTAFGSMLGAFAPV